MDQKQLAIGIAVEKEHSTNLEIRKTIALDHLAEDPMYYTKLVKSGIVDEKEALEEQLDGYKKIIDAAKDLLDQKKKEHTMTRKH